MDRTNAERQRRYVGKLKAAGQENTALRREVIGLKRELAQQRAMAKRRQQAADMPKGLVDKAGTSMRGTQGLPAATDKGQQQSAAPSAMPADSTLGSRVSTAVDCGHVGTSEYE